MKVSSRAHYGLRLMAELARHPGGAPVSLAEIARAEQLPVGYLEQLVVPLKRAGLLDGVRGAHGGYRLTRGAAQISAGEIVRALEGPIALVECLCDEYQPGACGVDQTCVSRSFWSRVRDSINQVLDSTTLADVCAEAGGSGAAVVAGRDTHADLPHAGGSHPTGATLPQSVRVRLTPGKVGLRGNA